VKHGTTGSQYKLGRTWLKLEPCLQCLVFGSFWSAAVTNHLSFSPQRYE